MHRHPFSPWFLAACTLLSLATTLAPERAQSLNLLANPGFETGDFSGWTIGGLILGAGVEVDGTTIGGTDPTLGDIFQNVRSGNYGGHALVSVLPDKAGIILSQDVAVTPDTLYSVGFFLGTDAPGTFGFGFASFGLPGTQIVVDGLARPFNPQPVAMQLDRSNGGNGDMPENFFALSTIFRTGAAQTQATVSFDITGSGTSIGAFSFDDFWVVAVPEPSTSVLGASVPCVGGMLRRSWQNRRSAHPSGSNPA